MRGLRRLFQAVRDGWGHLVRQPNLLLGVGALLAATALAIVFRPAMGPRHATKVVVETGSAPTLTMEKPPLPMKSTPEPEQGKKAPPPSAPVNITPASGEMPVTGRILAGYGFVFENSVDEWQFHPAWDIKGRIGESVKAAFPGVVTAVGPDPALGLSVTIQSGKLDATYAGLQDTALAVGERVKEGQAIGAVGKSGPLEAGEGPHLHFALTEDGRSLDPKTLITP